MERYELANGEVYEILRFTSDCAVAKNGSIVCSGTYTECRKFVERIRESARLNLI